MATTPYLFFDIGNVLLSIDFDRAWKKIAKETEPALDSSHVKDLFFTLNDGQSSDPLIKQLGRGKIDDSTFLNAYQTATGYTGTTHNLQNNLCDIFDVNVQNMAIFKAFKTHPDYQRKVALISDTIPMHTKFIDENFPDITDGLPSHAIIYSYSRGIKSRKEDGREIYDKATAAMMCDPLSQQCLMIDDRDQNGDNARQAGFTFIKVAVGINLEDVLTANQIPMDLTWHDAYEQSIGDLFDRYEWGKISGQEHAHSTPAGE